MEDVGTFYGHSVYFMATLSILWPFGIGTYVVAIWLCMVIWCIFPVLLCCTKKNLETLDPRPSAFSHTD
jgi:hypothetical protein